MILPISITVTPTWTDITDTVKQLGIIEEEVVNIFHNGGQLVEVIIDTEGTTTIDSTYDKQGTQILGSQTESFPFTQTTKFWVRRIKSTLIENSQIKISKQLNNVNINGVGKLDGALNIHDSDVHTIPVNEYFSKYLGVEDSLTSAASVGDTEVTVTNGSLFSVGDWIGNLLTPTEAIYKQITAININALTLDAPLDNDYPIGKKINVFEIDMNVTGTLQTPVSYTFIPNTGEVWHIVRFLFSMTHGTAGDLGLFGNLEPLINGAVLRAYDGASGTFRTFMNVKNNSDIKNNMYDVEFDTRSSGGGTYGTSGRGSIKIGTGAVPKLNGDSGDYFEILIQDDLTLLDSFRMKVQGHVEGK